MKFEVVYTQWTADEQLYGGGVHEVKKPSKKLLGLLAAAQAAGSVNVLEATRDERRALKSHVETQAESEKIYDRAQADGSWQVGNRAQEVIRRVDLAAADKSKETRLALEQARADFAELADHDEHALVLKHSPELAE